VTPPAELASDDPLAVAVVSAIRAGEVDTLTQLLRDHPGLASSRLVAADPDDRAGAVTRTLLHVATDWPGHHPNGPAVIAALIASGADVNARCTGAHTETPLHWAASSDDTPALDALLDAGADLEARGAVIGGGTALADATAFGQWHAARRLLERGAQPTFFDAAALGLLERVGSFLASDPAPTAEQINGALWGACHGDQQPAAELLLDHGADPHRVGWDGLTPLQAARRSEADRLADWIEQRQPG
jgi:ankyrin repeat protein